ncbi:MAG: hypothetical protein WC454_07075 [Phycisphaerae bacterium]|jgi:hypothetical protein
MPRIYRTQKEFEQFLIREFLDCLGYRISNPVWTEKPDALLTLSKGRKRKRVAIEHTEYFNDTKAGCLSPLTPIERFWRLVQASLVRRISHRKHLTGILATVNIKANLSLHKEKELARQLAKELVNFAEAYQVRQSEHLRFCCRDFNGYPMLKSMLSSLRLSRWTDDAALASRCSWKCSNITTGCIRLNMEYIKSAIKNKNKKATKYNWGDANEKWLLIAASGGNLSNNAGPAAIQNVNWADPELLDSCSKSPFDRIVFWERIRHWYKWLKPSEKVKSY